jgi:competence protein ComEC
MLGDRLSIDGIAKPPHATPGSRKFETIQGRMSVDGFVVVTQGSWIAHLADEWRRSFMAYVDRNLNEKAASLVDAICFNARSGVDPQTRQEMASSGTVHILSASGLQVFVFGFLVAMVLRFFPLHRSVQILALALVLVVYSIGAGLQPQIVRAACMTVLGLAAYMAKRDPDALSALALSGIAYLLWRPDSVYGMAFQVSFVTVACISLFYRRSSATRVTLRAEIVRYTKEFLSLSGIVVLASAPLIAYYLGVISMVSVFANLLVCWSLPLIVAVAFFGHGVSLLAPAVGDSIASHFLGPLCDWIYRVLDGMGRGFGTLDVPSFSGVWLLAFYGAWLMTYRRRVVQP